MLALIFDGIDSLYLENRPVPQIESSDHGSVLLRILRCGICGTDISIWKGGFQRVTGPVILGHEIYAEVLQVSQDAQDRLSPGDRVVINPFLSCGNCENCRRGRNNICKNLKVLGVDVGCDGGFSEFMKTDISCIYKVPSTVPPELAVLCEPVAASIHMVRRGRVYMGSEVLILGAGPIGILIAIAAQVSGASQILLTDINPYRINIAQEFGFQCIDMRHTKESALSSFFSQNAPDIIFEAVGSEITYQQAVRMSKMGGTIVSTGVGHGLFGIDMQTVTLNELDLIGTRLSLYDDFLTAFEFLARKDIAFQKLISCVVPLKDIISDGFEAIRSGQSMMKIIAQVHPDCPVQ